MLKTIQSRPRAIRILSFILMMVFLMVSLMTFIPVTKASAAEVAEILVAIETAAEWIEFMKEIGLIDGDVSLEDPSSWALTKSFSYISSMLTDYLQKRGSAVGTSQGLNDLVSYVSDTMGGLVKKNSSGEYYVGDKQIISPSQMAFKANEMPIGWTLPSNFKGSLRSLIYHPASDVSTWTAYYCDVNTDIRNNGGEWLTPWYRTDAGYLYVADRCFKLDPSGGSQPYVVFHDNNSLLSNTSYTGLPDNVTSATGTYRNAVILFNNSGQPSWNYTMEYGLLKTVYAAEIYSTAIIGDKCAYYNSDGTRRYVFTGSRQYPTSMREFANSGTNGGIENVTSFGFYVSSDVPSFDLSYDPSKVGEDVLVSPGGLDYDPSNVQGYQLASPEQWVVYGGTPQYINNHGTNWTQYINNGYIINGSGGTPDVGGQFNISGSINVNQNVTLGGGINVDITINDNTSLPGISDGDGENFFSANVIDVFAALTTNNPIIGTIYALFRSLDPALVAIVSVSISLMLVLALWKLIRG